MYIMSLETEVTKRFSSQPSSFYAPMDIEENRKLLRKWGEREWCCFAENGKEMYQEL